MHRIGTYSIIEELGNGRTGVLYRAVHEAGGAPVALRVLPQDIPSTQEFRVHFEKGFRLVAGLNHPNLAAGYEWGQEGPVTYLVSELFEGQDLRAIIAAEPPIAIEDKLRLMIQVAMGLRHAHQNGIVHGNIHPGNIFRTSAGVAKILDLGLVHMLAGCLKPAEVRSPSLLYLSPEQIQGRDPAGASDLFALGILFYQLLTGSHPYQDPQGDVTFEQILFQDEIATLERYPEIPMGFWPILVHCLAKNPQDRIRNAADLADGLRQLEEDLAEDRRLMRVELRKSLALRRGVQGAAGHQVYSEVERLLASPIPEYSALNRMLRTLGDLGPWRSQPPQNDDTVWPAISEGGPHDDGGSAADAIPPPVEKDLLPPPSPPASHQAAPEGQSTSAETACRPAPDATTPEETGLVIGLAQEEVAYLAQTSAALAENLEEQDVAVPDSAPGPTSGCPPGFQSQVLAPAAESSETSRPVPEIKEAGPAEAAVAPNSGRRQERVHRILAAIAAASVLLFLIGLGLPGLRRPPGPSPALGGLIAAARAGLDQGKYDEALRILSQIPENTPWSTAAHDLRDRVEQDRTAELLMSEARRLKDGGRLDESRLLARRVLELQPDSRSAQSLLSELETASLADSMRQEERAAAEASLALASTLIRRGKLDQARAEIDKAERYAGELPDLAEVQEQWQARRAALERTPAHNLPAPAPAASAELERTFARDAEDQFRRGEYDRTLETLGQWLAHSPSNQAAQVLRGRTNQLKGHLSAYESALRAKNYDLALVELARAGQINPDHPRLSELRSQVEARREAARASLTVYRLGDPGTILFDGRAIGPAGEVQDLPVPTGSHSLTIRYPNGRESSQIQHFEEDQHVVLIYESPRPSFRSMTEADRGLLAARRIREQVRRFPVEHTHGLFRGKCSGDLLVSLAEVEFRPVTGSHGFRLPFRTLRLTVEDRSVDLYFATDGKLFHSLKAPDPASVESLREWWDQLHSSAP